MRELILLNQLTTFQFILSIILPITMMTMVLYLTREVRRKQSEPARVLSFDNLYDSEFRRKILANKRKRH